MVVVSQVQRKGVVHQRPQGLDSPARLFVATIFDHRTNGRAFQVEAQPAPAGGVGRVLRARPGALGVGALVSVHLVRAEPEQPAGSYARSKLRQIEITLDDCGQFIECRLLAGIGHPARDMLGRADDEIGIQWYGCRKQALPIGGHALVCRRGLLDRAELAKREYARAVDQRCMVIQLQRIERMQFDPVRPDGERSQVGELADDPLRAQRGEHNRASAKFGIQRDGVELLDLLESAWQIGRRSAGQCREAQDD